jgi:DNA-binding NtrC family response regulator
VFEVFISSQLLFSWLAAWLLCLSADTVARGEPLDSRGEQTAMANSGFQVDDVALIGESTVMGALRAEIEIAARSQAKVLILGETGVGKEVVARLLHQTGARRARRFIAVNCSGIPETLLESELFGHTRGSFTGAYRDKPGLVRLADSGTLFLDELGEMSLRMQAVLLRFAETGEVQPVGADGPIGRTDVRLITATHRDLRSQIDSGSFREDLYYRLNVIQIRVPPLRERGQDVPLLLHYFLKRASEAHALPVPTLTLEAEQVLTNYRWPGNVRELKNVTERLVVGHASGRVTVEDLPQDICEQRSVSSMPVRTANAESSRPSDVSLLTSTGTTAEALWTRLLDGEDFWSAVHQPFRSHDLTRSDVRALIFRGLQHTRGNYRQLVKLFHMPDADYKRFLSFLSQHDCNLPFQAHRNGEAKLPQRTAFEVAC